MTTTSLMPREMTKKIFGALLLACIVVSVCMPYFASAQTAPAATPAATQAANPTSQPEPAACDTSTWSGWFSSWGSVICYTAPIAAWISSVLIYIAVWLLTVAGMLFNFLVDHTILNFPTYLYTPIQGAIEAAWTAFRDIANIVIIGMFVFIAISIILGNTEFGQKKMVAKVLVVAILINFSLLFTKVIIDFSNFTAVQFYSAAQLQTGGQNTAAVANSAGNQLTQKGIAGAFIHFLGVSSFGDTREELKNAAVANDSGLVVLLHGVVASIFLLAAAIVLLYGSFLLASRSILLIFLLLTSSIAFATYLFPSKFFGGFGWSMWWSSLLRSAVFAPILMILLWVTLTVGGQMNTSLASNKGTLGALLSNPSTGNYNILFAYIIMIGLLFISFKIASSFSATIGGFNYASILPALTAGAGARVAAVAGRVVLGGGGMAIGNALQEQARNTNRSDASRQLFNFAAKPFQAAAKKDFNALRNTLGSTMAKTAGMKLDALAGPKVGGLDSALKRTSQSLAEQAKRMAPSKTEFDAQKKIREDAAEQKSRENAAQSLVSAAREERVVGAEAAREAREKVRNEELKDALSAQPEKAAKYEEAKREVVLSEETIGKLNRQNDKAGEQLENTVKGMRKEMTTLRGNTSDRASQDRAAAIEKEIIGAKTNEVRMLKERNGAIKEATLRSREAARKVDRIEHEVLTSHREKAAAIQEGAKRTYADERASAIAERLANKSFTGILLKSVGMSGKLAEDAKKHLKEQVRRDAARLRAEERKKLDDEAVKRSPAEKDEEH